MCRHILLEVADVTPVTVRYITVQGVAFLQKERKQIFREIEGLALRDMIEHFRLQDVDAGVDGIGKHLAPIRLFQKAFYVAFAVSDNDPELQGIIDSY